MASLKAFLPVLASVLSTTADALYSRQRALTSLGVLQHRAGRGPGSGAPLSPTNIAAIVISLLTADTLAETDDRVVHTCAAKSDLHPKSHTFLEGVASIFVHRSDYFDGCEPVAIEVVRGSYAEIVIVDSKDLKSERRQRYLLPAQERNKAKRQPITAVVRLNTVALVSIVEAYGKTDSEA